MGCAIVLASPVLLYAAIEVGPLGGALVLFIFAPGYLLAAIASGYGLWWLTRAPQAALFRERRPGVRWTTPLEVLVSVVLLAVGAGLHAARPIERYLKDFVTRQDRELAQGLVGNLIAAVRAGNEQDVRQAEQALGESKSGNVSSYPNPQAARIIADALRRHDGPQNAELRRALLRALSQCKSGRGGFDVQQTILELVNDEDAEVRRLAVQGAPQSERAVDPLLRRVRDSQEDPRTRTDAAKKLEAIARNPGLRRFAPDIIAGLHEASQSDNVQVQAAAIDAIVQIDPQELARTVREGTLSVDEAIGHLVEVVRGVDWNRRVSAARALAEFGPSGRVALPELEAALAKATVRTDKAAWFEKAALQEVIDALKGSAVEAQAK